MRQTLLGNSDMFRNFYLLHSLLVVTTALKKGHVTWYPTGMSIFQTKEYLGTVEKPDLKAARHKEDFPSLKLFNRSLLFLLDDTSIKDKVRFYYYTRQNQYEPQELKPGQASSLLKENIEKPVKLVVHGFWHSSKNRMSVDLRKKLLDFLDVNVIAVDWHDVTRQFWYHRVVSTTFFVGRYVASLLDWLVYQGVNASDIHIMGHSLGAHVSGYAGAFLKRGKIGRISGLDPALPGFIDVHIDRRLDPSDAEFVDCIHTCGGILGLMDPIGHADFYPNGGTNLQPGCLGFDIIGVCSHLRATKYFTESIDPAHKFQAAQCPKIPDKEPLNCSWSEHFMGYHLSPSARGSFYVETWHRPPFSRGPQYFSKNLK